MNVYGITKKSISFFLSLFSHDSNYEDSIKRFVENEYRQDDREWAFSQFKNKRA
tara:strand:+ start:743 stop:904 length:162 start_codon:yes stop_codon:yes gene_type:complete